MTDSALTHATTQPQPIAWALAAGHCPVIMSDTRPGMEHEGRLIGIHAGQARTGFSALAALVRSAIGIPSLTMDPPLIFGALIGVARLVGVVAMRRIWDGAARESLVKYVGRSVFTLLGSPDELRIRPWWRSGTKWGLLLAEAVLLPEPIPMHGAGAVWRIRGWNADGGSGEFLGEDYPGQVAGWALEQWRKARGE